MNPHAFIRLEYCNLHKLINSFDMAGNDVNAAVFLAHEFDVANDQEMILLKMLSCHRERILH